MPGAVFLEGETVALRTIEREDAEWLRRTINDLRVRRYLLAYAPMNLEQERDWVESLAERDGVNLLACVDGDPVGSVGMKEPNVVWGNAEIGYYVDPEHWGNGYATEAVELLVQYAFEERRLHTLHADIVARNEASARVLEKVGFETEGVRREAAFVDGEYVDVHNYGLVATDWRQQAET